MNNNRKVKVYRWELNDKGRRTGRKVEKCEAIFHSFGVDYEEFETGAGNFSTAIIEHNDGSVQNIGVEMIRFINEQ